MTRMKRTILMRVAFDGTDFHGWQSQPGLRTVQSSLKEAVQRVVRHPVEVTGSGRTDAGVHARAHVDSFVTTCDIPCERLWHAIGSRLDTDLAILDIQEVHEDFDVTRSAVSKTYRYRIHNAEQRPVERNLQRSAFHCWRPLDVSRMRDGARHLVGTMNFTSMAPKGTVRESMVRRVIRCEIERHLDEVRIDVEGEGFLHNQVRNMAGTLIEVGRGLWEPDRVARIIEARDRNEAGPTAPAHGLCLMWVHYPAQLLRPAPAEA